ncbi:MAG: type II toxin-antitoxin system Phd/YefM family antitoxin [Chloroflexota bacterium]|nr:type II toxin-antitoxin system Phd/YefM family antitoxin [Chloroflexota bacterium]
MEKTVGAFEARRQLGRILKAVAGRGDRYVLEYHGEPVAAVVPLALYEGWKRRREAFFDRLEVMATTADLSPEEADALATEAVRTARGS